MSLRTRRIWSAIGVTVIVDIVWLWWSGMTVAWQGIAQLLGAVVLLLGIARFYQVTRRSDSLQYMAETAAQLLVFSASGAVLSYLVATTSVPLMDPLLVRADVALGFRWAAWTGWIQRHPLTHVTLMLAYMLELPAILFCLLYLAAFQAAEEFLWLYILTGLITILISGVVPALGHFPQSRAAAQVLALRAGTLTQVPLPRVEGLISFPSFHTCLALVIAYAMRVTRMRWVMGCLAGVILLSIPSEGGHYLVDLLGGIGVTGVAIVMSSRVLVSEASEWHVRWPFRRTVPADSVS